MPKSKSDCVVVSQRWRGPLIYWKSNLRQEPQSVKDGGSIVYKEKTSFDLFYLFRSIMRSGSFQKAAKEDGSTASSVSRKMTQLENELGIELFIKGSDGMTPTAAGLFLYDKIDAVLWNVDAILQQARNIPKESSMKLNLGISETLPGSVYRPLVQCFTQSHPDIHLTLSSPSWRDMSRRLVEGTMDAALTYSIGLQGEVRLARKTLVSSGACIFYSDQMPLETPEEITVQSFRSCTFVCLDTDVAPMDMLKGLPFKPPRVIFAENLKTLFLYVNAGLACTILSPFQQIMENENILAYFLSDSRYAMGIDLTWEKSNDNPAIPLLLDCAEKVFSTTEEQ